MNGLEFVVTIGGIGVAAITGTALHLKFRQNLKDTEDWVVAHKPEIERVIDCVMDGLIGYDRAKHEQQATQYRQQQQQMMMYQQEQHQRRFEASRDWSMADKWQGVNKAPLAKEAPLPITYGGGIGAFKKAAEQKPEEAPLEQFEIDIETAWLKEFEIWSKEMERKLNIRK